MKKKHLMQLMAGIPDEADLNFNLFLDRGDGKISAFCSDELTFIGLDFSTDETNNEICSTSIKLYTELDEIR
jgi:hypothetical protein